MNEMLLNALDKLKQDIETNKDIIILNKIECEMNNSEEVMRLAYQKDVALDKYNNVIKFFSDDSKEVTEARKELQKAKIALETNEIVKKYLETYKKVKKIYNSINEIVFNDFITKCECKK